MNPEPQEPSFDYDVFISYSRRDIVFARALEKALEDYSPPGDLAVPQRHLVVFRDEEDFTGVEYNNSVREHLKNSDKMLVICSPHSIDLASPSLIKACASGRHIKEAVVTVQKAGPEPQEFLVIKLYEVIVTSVETGVDTLQNSVTENVSISFSRIEFVYTEQKPDGTLGGSNRVLWDIISNEVT